jgi:hypothetical protein
LFKGLLLFKGQPFKGKKNKKFPGAGDNFFYKFRLQTTLNNPPRFVTGPDLVLSALL